MENSESEEQIYILSEERIGFISDIANDEWVYRLPEDEQRREKEFDRLSIVMEQACTEFLKNTNSTEELHEFAERYNWGKGTDSLIDLVRNPACDKNTALLIFWLAIPADYQEQYSSREDIEGWNLDHKNIWDLIHYIIESVTDGSFRTSDMPDVYKKEISKARNPLWEIPSFLYADADEVTGKQPKLNKYDRNFSAYGPHCTYCNESIESLEIKVCPHCSKHLNCDCIYCKKSRGENES